MLLWWGCQAAAVAAHLGDSTRDTHQIQFNQRVSKSTRDAGTGSSPSLVAGLFGFLLSHINTRPSWRETG